MTVKELKEFIAELPEDATICIQTNKDYCVVKGAVADFHQTTGELVKRWVKNEGPLSLETTYEVLSGPVVTLVS